MKYGILATLVFLLVGLALLLDVPQFVKLLIATPGVAGLFVALHQIVRDILAHERESRLQEQEQRYQAGFASHMANVAFDKHVEFCERYIGEVNSTVEALIREGPTRNALQSADRLAGVRREFATWVTPDIAEKLQQFEAVLRQVGAHDYQLESMPVGEERSQVVEEMFDLFTGVLGAEGGTPNEARREIAHSRVIGRLQKVLGIDKLTRLRVDILESVKEAPNHAAAGAAATPSPLSSRNRWAPRGRREIRG